MARKPIAPAPTTEWVPIASLTVDPTVNTRPMKKAKVEKIDREFDPAMLGTIEVSQRPDGTLVILDGQHRVEGARRRGWTNGHVIECRVHRGLSHSEECRYFRLLNDETAVAPIYKMMAAIGEGHNPDAAINTIVESVGLRIAGQAGDGLVCSAKALRYVYGGARFKQGDQFDHPELLRATLRTILAAWGKSKDGLRGDIIEGTGAFLARYTAKDGRVGLEKDVLISRLAQVTPLQLLADARSLRSIHGWQLSGAIAARIVILYNTGKRSKRLPDWWSAA